MTPRFWHKIALTISNSEKSLVRIGVTCLILFILFISINLRQIKELNPLVLLPLIIVFLCCGLGLIRYHFKTTVDSEAESFDQYVNDASKSKKIMMWYSSLFMTFWFCGLVVMFCMILIAGFNHNI